MFGIKDTSDTFQVNIAEASVHIEPLYGNIPVVSFRLDNGEHTEVTQAFKDFTEQNLFKSIATEIDGVCIIVQQNSNCNRPPASPSKSVRILAYIDFRIYRFYI